MSYSTLRRSRTYIVVPRDVDPQNFIYVPETRKVRNIGIGKCFFVPLLVFLVVGAVLGVAGYFLHQYSIGENLLEWPENLNTKSGILGVEHQSESGNTHSDHSGPGASSCYDLPGKCHNVQNDDNDTGGSDPCSGSPCQGGGTCETHDGTFTCYCTKDRTGKYCERLLTHGESDQVAGFTGQSRVTLINTYYKHTTPKYAVSFKIKPLSGEGVIIHSGHTIIALVNGHLQFSYGNTSKSLVLQSTYPLTLNTWHQVTVQTYHADVMMQIHGDKDRMMGRLVDGHSKIDALSETINIGSMGAQTTLPGYTGCVSELKIDNIHVSLIDSDDGVVSVSESVGVVQCSDLTRDLMVSDQAPVSTSDQETFVFTNNSVQIMNRVTKKLFSEKRTVISFEIKTLDTEAVIFSIGNKNSDYFQINLVKGHLQVKLKIGSKSGSMQSKLNLNDGEWRKVSVERSGGKVLTRIDTVSDIFSLDIGHNTVDTRTWPLTTSGVYTLGQGLSGKLRNIKIKDRTVKHSNVL